MSTELKSPARTIFGAGTIQDLNREIPNQFNSILVVTGQHVKNSGLLERITAILAGRKLTITVGIQAEPPLPEVNKLIDAGRQAGVQAVIAIGGGSVIDSAKTAAAIIPLPGRIEDYFSGAMEITGKGLFFAALPTTAGTGAEITPNAVLTDPVSGIKKSLRHDTMMADLAIIDPDLLAECSRSIAVNSGLDALTQAIESYISLGATPLTRVYASRAVQLLYKHLPAFCEDRGNEDARCYTAEGSMLGAIAFATSGLGAVHGLGHPIGALRHIPHGLCCAILLPHILRWNEPVCADAYRSLAQNCQVADFPAAIADLCGELGIPENFRQFGLSERDFPFIVKNCRSNSMKQNPRPMTDSEVISLLQTLI